MNMKLVVASLLGLSVYVANPCHAGVIYTDEASFIAAVGVHSLEDFESTALGGVGQSFTTASGLTFNTSGTTMNAILGSPGTFGTQNTTPGGSRFLESNSMVGSAHDPVLFGHTGGTMSAWGANFTDLDFGSIEFLLDGVSTLTPAPGPDEGTLFFGFVGPADFVEVRINTNDRTWGVDDVRWTLQQRPVPEPASLAMFGLGAIGLVGLRRRRR